MSEIKSINELEYNELIKTSVIKIISSPEPTQMEIAWLLSGRIYIAEAHFYYRSMVFNLSERSVLLVNIPYDKFREVMSVITTIFRQHDVDIDIFVYYGNTESKV